MFNYKLERCGFSLFPHRGVNSIIAVMRFGEHQGLKIRPVKFGNLEYLDLINQNDYDVLEQELLTEYQAHVVKNPGGSWDWLYFDDKNDYAEFILRWWGV